MADNESLFHDLPRRIRTLTHQSSSGTILNGKDSESAQPAPPPPDSDEITWDGPQDETNPQNWRDGRKWLITMTCIIMSTNVTFASSAPSSAVQAIRAQFHLSAEVSYLITFTFLLGYVLGPFVWGPGSELIGRRPTLVFAMSIYTLLYIPQALAPNIQTLLTTRFLCGFFGVAPLVSGGGVLADVWSTDKRGLSMSLWSTSAFLGPVLGPIIAGFIVDSTSLNWRWVFWVGMMFAGACTLFTAIFLPETYAPVILLRKVKERRRADPEGSKQLYAAHEKQDWSPWGIMKRTLFRPFIMLSQELILVLVTIYICLIYGVMYMLFEALPIIFVEKHGFTIAQNGLIFIGVGIGTVLGALSTHFLATGYPQLIKTWRGFPPPEERLRAATLGAPVFVIGIFWLGWTGEYASIPWYVPALSTIPVGFGISAIFISFLSYLIDTYLMYAASAFAANTVARSLVAAGSQLFTVQMFGKMGVGYACTLLGGVGLVLAPMPFLFFRYGARVREGSRWAPGLDLKVKEQIEEEKIGMAV
ncbi:major facilitator superfamily domain-containing protein [Roridomyces roridus]|uniref:Major facilitator superfamily domain-containing protein n=1 Tax=Roridomyces roridus TaxID=1738132 RepID=A0AAD7FCT3_9AGAR|nr:major facilitator superfamily domain-containing protein [Roridomyces roridus]